MSRPEITINDKQIVIVTATYRLHLEFPAYVDPAAVELWGKCFEKAKHIAPKKVTEVPTPVKEQGIRKTKDQRFHDYMNAPIRRYNDKVCKACGKSFSPTGPSQVYCADACNPKKGKKLDEMSDNELDKTLAQIEERRNKTYLFDK